MINLVWKKQFLLLPRKKILRNVLQKRPEPLPILKKLGKSNVFSLSSFEHIFHFSGIAMHQSLFIFIFASITSPPGHSAHFKYSGNIYIIYIFFKLYISSYYKPTIYGLNLKCIPLLFELPSQQLEC